MSFFSYFWWSEDPKDESTEARSHPVPITQEAVVAQLRALRKCPLPVPRTTFEPSALQQQLTEKWTKIQRLIQERYVWVAR